MSTTICVEVIIANIPIVAKSMSRRSASGAIRRRRSRRNESAAEVAQSGRHELDHARPMMINGRVRGASMMMGRTSPQFRLEFFNLDKAEQVLTEICDMKIAL